MALASISIFDIFSTNPWGNTLILVIFRTNHRGNTVILAILRTNLASGVPFGERRQLELPHANEVSKVVAFPSGPTCDLIRKIMGGGRWGAPPCSSWPHLGLVLGFFVAVLGGLLAVLGALFGWRWSHFGIHGWWVRASGEEGIPSSWSWRFLGAVLGGLRAVLGTLFGCLWGYFGSFWATKKPRQLSQLLAT